MGWCPVRVKVAISGLMLRRMLRRPDLGCESLPGFVPRTPWDMLRERRSIEELEELLKERLEIIKSRRRGS